MNTQTINFVLAALATAGLFFLVGGITGRIRLSLSKRPGSLDEYGGDEGPKPVPLAVRMAQSITEALPFGRFGLGEDPLRVQLARAGNPYESATQFYQRKVAYMGVYAVGALVLCVLLGLPIPVTLVVVVIAGVLGLMSPESVIANRIDERRDALRREMAFMLDRVAFAVMAYGTVQETLSHMSDLAQPDSAGARTGAEPEAPDLSFEERTRVAKKLERESRQFKAMLGAGLVGMGGGLFAELLNRMAMLLSAGTGEGFEEVREKLERLYPISWEVSSFLDIVEAGLRGAPMADRLFELADDMIEELAQEQREAGMRATRVVTAIAGASLIPALMLLGAPAFALILTIFGG